MKENPVEFTKKQEAENCEWIQSRLSHNMLDMISEVDINGIRTYVSPSHKTIIGYETDFLRGKSVFEFTHPDDMERLKYEFNKGIKEQKPVKIEYRRLHADGYYIWVESMGNPVYDKDGKFIGGIITTRDITERKKYEKALEYRLAIEKLITSLATGFINISTCDIDEEINKSLKILGTFMGAARACMYIVSDTDETEVYKWHIEGHDGGLTINPSIELFSRIISKLKSGEVVYISNISEVPDEAEYLKNSGIYSFISIPIITHNIFTGFIGFENFSSEREWKEEDIRLMKLMGEIFTHSIERRNMEYALHNRLSIEDLVTSISTNFINISFEDIDREINKTLKIIGEFSGVDRCVISASSNDGMTVEYLYKWNAPDINETENITEGINIEPFQLLREKISSFDIIHIPGISDLPGEAEKKFRTGAGIKSLLSIPMLIHNNLKGFLTLNSIIKEKIWKEEDIRLLKLVADIFVNILKRKESEEKLRKSESSLAQTQKIAGLGSYESNPASGKLIWSEETFRITGMDPLRGEPSLDEYINMIHSEERFTAKEKINKAIREKKSFDFEYRIILPDGSLKYIQSIGHPVINDKENVNKIVGTIMDITERKKGEEERKKIEERLRFVQKHESLGKMAGGIAHGFNNILASILGYTEITLMDLPPASKVTTYIKQIEKSVYRGSEITKQMLSYTGHGKFILESIEISKLIREMYQFIQITISNKCNVEYVLEENLPYIKGDNDQIRQAIMNLIMNASEALEDNNGIITLKTGKIICNRDYLHDKYQEENLSEGLYIYLDISDTGCGMSEDTMSKIFDPFFTTKFPGRGLGLAAVHGIIRAHKGAIKVFSKKGEGTTIKLLFPVLKSLQEQKLIKSNIQTKGKTILIIDDAEDICTIVNNILQRVGFRVISAPDGLQGLKLFREYTEDISLVILDMTMPVMDGKKTFQELKLIKSDIPVIVTSGYNEEQAIKTMGVSNIAGFIQKPYKSNNLVKLIKKVIDRQV